MTVLVIVLVAGILLTWMLVHSYSGRDAAGFKRHTHPSRAADGGDVSWMTFGGDSGGASDCGSSSDGGGCGGDGGGGGGGD